MKPKDQCSEGGGVGGGYRGGAEGRGKTQGSGLVLIKELCPETKRNPGLRPVGLTFYNGNWTE